MKIKIIKAHFKKVDPVIFKTIKDLGFETTLKPLKPTAYFKKLCQGIVSQQLGNQAARAIVGRFIDLFPKGKVSPRQVLALTDQALRDAGMSWAKAGYIKNLAQKTKNKKIKFKDFPNLNDDQVILELTKVKGIGPWTAEMFLMFTLGRENVFSHGDLGLRKAIEKLYGFKKKPTVNQINRIIKKWTPYKTYGCLILWKSIDN